MLYKLIWQLFGTAVDNETLLHTLQPERYGLRVTHNSSTCLSPAYLPQSCLMLEHQQEWAMHCPDAAYQQAFFDCLAAGGDTLAHAGVDEIFLLCKIYHAPATPPQQLQLFTAAQTALIGRYGVTVQMSVEVDY